MKLTLERALSLAAERGIETETARGVLLEALLSGDIQATATVLLTITPSESPTLPCPSEDPDRFREMLSAAHKMGATIDMDESAAHFAPLDRAFWYRASRLEHWGVIAWDGSWAKYVAVPYVSSLPPKPVTTHIGIDIEVSGADIDRLFLPKPCAVNDHAPQVALGTVRRDLKALFREKGAQTPRYTKEQALADIRILHPGLSGAKFRALWADEAPPHLKTPGPPKRGLV